MKTYVWLAAVTLPGCAGPTTPLGAVRSFFPVREASLPVPHSRGARAVAVSPARTNARMRFIPERQSLHERSDLKIIIDDPSGIPDKHEVTATYNGLNVTESFLSAAKEKITRDGTRLEITLPDLRLPAGAPHQIEFAYHRDRWFSAAEARFEEPTCDPSGRWTVKDLGRFRPPLAWMRTIYKSSKGASMNPSLLTGLIAQESGFDPRAISWARALGLTQVTPLADEELERYRPEWPRSEEVRSMSVAGLKAMILSNAIGGEDDWRLDPQLSIQGGVTYLIHLNKYWRSEANYARVAKVFEDPEDAIPELILASYNSGPSRVMKALKELGPWYLSSDELKEARKYVQRITSYCYHFAHVSGEGHEDPS